MYGLLLLSLLIAVPAFADMWQAVVVSGTTTTTVPATTTTIAASTATNYSTSCGLVYTFESETNGDPADATGSAAAACDGTDNGTINRTTGIQGSTAAEFTSGSEYFTVSNADCLNYIDSGSASNKTIAFLIKPNATNTATPFYAGDYDGANGYSFRKQTGDGVTTWGKPEFRIGGTNKAATTILDTGTTYAVAATYNNTSHVFKIYVNGTQEGTNGSATLVDSAPTSMKVMGNSSNNLTAVIDDLAYCNFEATQAQLCQIASCGIDGSACTCSGATYTDAGLNATFGCSLTGQDCNAAAP